MDGMVMLGLYWAHLSTTWASSICPLFPAAVFLSKEKEKKKKEKLWSAVHKEDRDQRNSI